MRPLAAAAAALALGLAAPSLAAAPGTPAYVARAIADHSRTAADRGEDAHRKGAALLAFAGVKPGERMLELIPGGGYFTRLFSRVVGPNGHIYAMWPDEYAKLSVDAVNALTAVSQTPTYRNVSVYTQPAARFSAPEPLDLVFTSQNFHDYDDKFMGNVGSAVFARQVYAALKPGGRFIVIDHVAQPGSGLRDTDTLHRIDAAKAKAEILAAGFVFAGESRVLRNPADTHKLTVFDAPIRGHTDQFAYAFRKPARR